MCVSLLIYKSCFVHICFDSFSLFLDSCALGCINLYKTKSSSPGSSQVTISKLSVVEDLFTPFFSISLYPENVQLPLIFSKYSYRGRGNKGEASIELNATTET